MKKSGKNSTLYKEDIMQSVLDLTQIQTEMLGFILSGLTSEHIDIGQFYSVSAADILSLRKEDPASAYRILEKEAQALFDQFVMVRGGLEAETDEDIEFYRWFSQLRYYEEDKMIGFLFSDLVRLYLPEIQNALAQRQEKQAQGELNLFGED